MTQTTCPISEVATVDRLVARAGTDRAAFAKLYSLYYPRVFKYCLRRLFLRATAEDVTGAVFLAVARRLPRFDGRTEADFRNWVYAIATNQINAQIRSHHRRKRLLEQAVRMKVFRDSASTDASDRLDWPTVYAAVMALRPREQSIVGLRFFEGMSHEQIGAVLNLKAGTVRVVLSRALAKLRQRLGAERVARFDGR